MPYLILTRRDRTDFTEDAARALFPAETAQVRVLMDQGAILGIWDRGDAAGVCIVLDAADEAEMNAVLATLPLFQAGMIAVERTIPLSDYFGTD